jgi:hypothetical protein
VIFDDVGTVLDFNNTLKLATTKPQCQIKTADAPNIARDDTLTIGTIGYKVTSHLPDGTGTTKVELVKA